MAALPPVRLVQVLRASCGGVPGAGGQVLPAAVAKHNDDIAAVHLFGEAEGDVQGGAGGDAGEKAFGFDRVMRSRDRRGAVNKEPAVELLQVKQGRRVALL